MRKAPVVVTVVAAAAVVLIGVGVWWQYRERAAPAPLAAPPAAASVAAAAPPLPPASAASMPAIQYPVEPLASEAATPRTHDVTAALGELFGSKAVLSMFQTQDFARRFVATIDNLGRAQAPPALWPMNPAGGRFMVDKQGDAQVIAADNGARYTPYVLLMETVDLRQAVVWYVRLYPQLQQAYENLGFPGRYFNDRFVAVIDQLLATPDAGAATKVHLPAINGPVQPPRPWVLYEFDDPALDKLAAGQKILLRMGAVNERRVKAKLVELRRLLVAGAPPR
jgi:Protein of unknown function (DUF3014)